MNLSIEQLESCLEIALSQGCETEWIEFKENFHGAEELGQTLSALANGACYAAQPYGYLLFGISDEMEILGTTFNFLREKRGAANLELWLRNAITREAEYHVFDWCRKDDGKRLVIFIIQAAQTTPVQFQSQPYIRINSHIHLLHKYPTYAQVIWRKGMIDWSATTSDAVITDLDEDAISYARKLYSQKNPHLETEINSWDDSTFLNKIKLTINNKITHAALILLGRPESATLLNPCTPRITWILRDKDNNVKDYQHFEPPILLAINQIYAKIRNLKYRYIQDQSLFPQEIDQYDAYTIREALNNCIAHQDYRMGGNISIVEKEDSTLNLRNHGEFIPKSINNVIDNNAPEQLYRNRLLVEAMVNLKMIDTIGSGIRRMFKIQSERFFPLPDYDFSDNQVSVTITGKVIDLNYAKKLAIVKDLTLHDIMLLDKIQKKLDVTGSEAKYLKEKGLVEGKRPNLFISSTIASATNQKAKYIKHVDLGNQHYEQLVLKTLERFGDSTRSQIDECIFPNLPENLDMRQKTIRVKNILQQLRKKGLITSSGQKWHKV
ncbi:putative DNA binding domain-containing protein [Acinetobacter ursingii]|uniref:RNA-binding domain-containing protein n=4 Tax=Acinetobacter ursingii TaxID=108980 RepID=UPI0021CD7BE1|nr:RNA-binding domain-containing protein [Acinetobacter ursingii]MCU4306232.1 putative DNA binding domain-containing protein [Acinetobacter ursingii]MCU4371773.1 putative DNA binding domain-containing protein [Acinetobacter ursingii]MDG9992907.1 putative DNA binding domain-containing protein [Acinetobacter ursingii]MDH0203840.1 putative DNA binding domain-containing protein [Acinetobacter ursingii]MDU4394398.1 putative DNA binding domain-containing protein [Acinetobacter ursingii]